MNIQNALGVLLEQGTSVTSEEWEELEEVFGDQLVMLASHENEYALCAI
jgi:hypothetical protein